MYSVYMSTRGLRARNLKEYRWTKFSKIFLFGVLKLVFRTVPCLKFWAQVDVDFKDISHTVTRGAMKLIHVSCILSDCESYVYSLSFLQTQWHQRKNINKNVHITVWSVAKGRGFHLAQVGVERKRWGCGGGDDDSIFLYLTNLPLLAHKKLVCDQSLGALDAFDSNKPRYTLMIFQDCKKLFFSKQ